MHNIKDIINELILEVRNNKNILEILKFNIEANLRCKIYYAGDNTVKKGWRTIEPYALGLHYKSGNVVLRALQVTRSVSDTPNGNGKDPYTALPNGWRMFRLDGIKDIKSGGGKFNPSKRREYNPDDKHMKEIIVSVAKTKKRVGDLYNK